jgi:hypothetical protein
MIFRPNPWKVGLSGSFLLAAGLVAAFADGIPAVGRAIGWVLVVLVPAGLWVIVKTSVTIRVNTVEVGRPFGSRTFEAGAASMRIVAMPAGLIRDGKAIQLKGADGQTAVVTLGVFARHDRPQIVDAVRGALGQGTE